MLCIHCKKHKLIDINIYFYFSFLEKRDFLERTDLRQFELEKSMRAANRSNRN